MPAPLRFRFQPPLVDPEQSNIENSENTALFLTSCFEYIFSGVILNGGRPFRQPAWGNCKSHFRALFQFVMSH